MDAVSKNVPDYSSPQGAKSGTAAVNGSHADAFSSLVRQEPASVEDFKQDVRDRAVKTLGRNSKMLDETENKYLNPNSPAYDTLRKAITKDQELRDAEKQAQKVFNRKTVDYMGMNGDYNLKNPHKSAYDEAAKNLESIQSARSLLQSQYPELIALDTSKVDAGTSNAELSENLTEGFDRIREDILEAQEKIWNDDVPLELLTNVIKETRQDPKYADVQDGINEWISDEKFWDNAITWGTAGLATIATLATIPLGGWGGAAIIGAAGALAGGAGAVYHLERAVDFYDVSQAQQVGEQVSDVSLEEARFNLVMSAVDLVAGGLDVVTAIKAAKMTLMGKEAVAAKNIDNSVDSLNTVNQEKVVDEIELTDPKTTTAEKINLDDLFSPDQISALNSTVDSFTDQIVKKGQKDQFLKDPRAFITQRLSIGDVVESLGTDLVRGRANANGMISIENATLQFIDKNGKVVGGKGPELDFLLSKDSNIVEIISAKMDPRRVKPKQDIKLFSAFNDIPINDDVTKLRAYLNTNFGNNKAFNQVVDVQVTSNQGTQSLDSFRQQYIGSDSKPEVVGLTPKSDAYNANGIQLDVTKEELIDITAKMIEDKLQ